MRQISIDNAAPTGKREQNRLRNRAAILRAGRECFRSQGYDHTTIRDIVRRTGLAAGTFYNYFASKQDIFAALLTGFLSQLNQNLEILRAVNESPDKRIRSNFLALFLTVAEDPMVYELAHRNEQTIRLLFGSDLFGLAMLSLEDDLQAFIGNMSGMESSALDRSHSEYLKASFQGMAYQVSVSLANRCVSKPGPADQFAADAANFATLLFFRGARHLNELCTSVEYT